MIGVETDRRRKLLGYAAALGAALAYGSTTLIAQKITRDYTSPIVGTAFSMLFGTIIVAGLFHRDAIADGARAPRQAWVWVCLAGLTSAWGVSFWFLAISRAPIVLVAPLAGIHPLIAIVLAHFFLQRLERVTWRIVVGAMLVVVGVVLIALGNN